MEMNDAKLIEFTHIPPEAGVWRQVLDLGTRLRFRKGEEIMHGGEKGEYLYYVHQGEARLMRTTLDGREKILMSMRSGTVTGETPFFDEVPARSSIVAGTDCVVYACGTTGALRSPGCRRGGTSKSWRSCSACIG